MTNMHQMQWEFANYLSSLHSEGYVDDQFTQLQKLADDSSPNFVTEVVTLFFQDSETLISNLVKALEQPVVDFNQIANHAHQFKGSSSSVGANKIKNICAMFRGFCEEKNHAASRIQRCIACLQSLQYEYKQLEEKLNKLFKMEQDIVKYGGKIPRPSMD